MTVELFRQVLDDEMAKLKETLGEAQWTAGHFDQAIKIFDEMATAETCEEFLTLPAYRQLLENEKAQA